MSYIKKLIREHDTPDLDRITARLLVIFFFFVIVFLTFVPWTQTSTGSGRVIAFSPTERVQDIHAPVQGRVSKWFVHEGSVVKKGDPIVELIDIDPLYLKRLELNVEAIKRKYQASVEVTKTAKYDKDRQEDLFIKGLSSRKDKELAYIAYENAQSAQAQVLAEVADQQARLERQKGQRVTAPRDGTVIRIMQGTGSVLVNQGDVIAVFVPMSDKLAAEFFIPGNDLPLVYEGRKVRLQFEGWPAVQFSGWPSVAVGTFEGKVVFVDQTANSFGEFRVIAIPSGKNAWPAARFIRQGTRVNGWILLNQVSFGFEMWRQFNGFPPKLDKGPVNLPTGLVTNE